MGGNFYRVKTAKGYEIVPAPEPVLPLTLEAPADVSLGGKHGYLCDLCEKKFVSEITAETHFNRKHKDIHTRGEWRTYFSPVTVHGAHSTNADR